MIFPDHPSAPALSLSLFLLNFSKTIYLPAPLDLHSNPLNSRIKYYSRALHSFRRPRAAVPPSAIVSCSPRARILKNLRARARRHRRRWRKLDAQLSAERRLSRETLLIARRAPRVTLLLRRANSLALTSTRASSCLLTRETCARVFMCEWANGSLGQERERERGILLLVGRSWARRWLWKWKRFVYEKFAQEGFGGKGSREKFPAEYFLGGLKKKFVLLLSTCLVIFLKSWK